MASDGVGVAEGTVAICATCKRQRPDGFPCPHCQSLLYLAEVVRRDRELFAAATASLQRIEKILNELREHHLGDRR